jgi:AcrR family transcriptional regulator
VSPRALFTYFKTKDELVNARYREILAEMTMELVDEEPAGAAEIQALGFRLPWGALRSKP